jgi:glucosamine kinase
LLQREPGFAAILGTGTNTALYDGQQITMNVDSLGYFLGDEGSGTHIAKKLLRDYMRRQMPGDMHNAFGQAYPMDKETVLDTLYNDALPNRFLASFAPFASDNRSHDYIRGLVRSCFVEFFEQLVTRYPDYQNFTFNCVGSIGFIFQDLLTDVCKQFDMAVGNFMQEPINALVDYHVKPKA